MDGFRIRAARKALGWSVDQLAESSGLGRDTIVRIERNDFTVKVENVNAAEVALIESGRIKFGRNGAVTILSIF